MDKIRLFSLCETNKVCFASTECIEGSVFFALPGAKVDGHQYLRDAAERGALTAVIHETYQGNTYGLDCFRVKDTKALLQEAAKEAVKNHGLHIIGITGSCGKTTTKDFTAAMLGAKYDVEKTPGTRNSQIGLPTAILNMRKDADLYVFEMGMSKAGEIARLVTIAPPEVAAITMIGRAHLEYFDSIEGIAHAKGEIFTSSKLKKGFIGESAARFPFLAERRERVAFSYFEELAAFPSHYHENASIALAIAQYYGVQKKEALATLHDVKDPRRFSLSEKDGIYWLSDSYNCIPEALLAALKNLPKKGKRKGAVLSPMGELGVQASAIHKELAEEAVRYLDYLICYGEHMKAFRDTFLREGKHVLWFATREEAAVALQNEVKRGDLILVKGANTQKLWELIPCCS